VEFVAVDGAQTAGMLPLDLAASGVDFYSTSGHKWIQAPKGTGLLYVRREVRENVAPMWMTWGQARWEGTVRVLEDYGTRNLAEILVLGDAIAFQNDLGRQRAERDYANSTATPKQPSTPARVCGGARRAPGRTAHRCTRSRPLEYKRGRPPGR